MVCCWPAVPPVAAKAQIMAIVSPMAHRLDTERLALRPWIVDDAEAALGAYGDAEVARWLAPAMDQVNDLAAMRVVLQQWVAEAGLALARWAFDQGIEQVIALVRPTNTRAATMVQRMGMEWVGETEKYHNLRLQEYRLRPGDLA